MARVSKRAPTDTRALQAAVDALGEVGLRAHQRVRFRRGPAARWTEGVALALDADGSVGLQDARGRRRSIPVEDIEVPARGPRGGRVWVPLREVPTDSEQLGLF